MGRRLGDPEDPLLVSVRSGAKHSMPGMMETVLNIGLNDESVQGLARQSDDERFAMDSYRRLLQMFGDDRARHRRRGVLRRARRASRSAAAPPRTPDLGVEDLRELVATYKQRIEEHAGRGFPQDPREQMDLAVARRLRLLEHRARRALPPPGADPRGPRHRGEHPGDGVRQPRAELRLRAWRSPATRRRAARACTATTSRTPRARTSSPASATPSRWPTSARSTGPSHDELLEIMATLEHHYRDMCDIEFTVEQGKLWMLQTRVGKRTPEAAFRIAVHMVDEGLIDLDEALRRVNGAQLAQLMFPRFDENAERDAARHGHERLPRRGGRQGRLRLGDGRRVGRARRGRDPGPQGDQPRRPARHGGRPRRADQPRRQDLARRRRGPRHGPHLRVRRRGARRSTLRARRSPSATGRCSTRAT